MSSIPTIDVHNLAGGALPAAFRTCGFAALVGHAIDEALLEPAYEAVRDLFALPESAKLRYHQPDGAGERGYTPFGRERAKDRCDADLKEFWHVGREPARHPGLSPNVWPAEIPAFQPRLRALYHALDALGAHVLEALTGELGLAPGWFADKIDHGNSILRPLHYPPLAGDPGPAVRSAAHEDINVITLMVGAGEPGLQILRPDGSWLPVDVQPGQVIVNVGDMLQRLTNHVFSSTTHRVVNPEGPRRARARYSLPFFLHFNPEFLIETLPSCVGPDRPDRYPTPITADAYLRERLREIGLLVSTGQAHSETAGWRA